MINRQTQWYMAISKQESIKIISCLANGNEWLCRGINSCNIPSSQYPKTQVIRPWLCRPRIQGQGLIMSPLPLFFHLKGRDPFRYKAIRGPYKISYNDLIMSLQLYFQTLNSLILDTRLWPYNRGFRIPSRSTESLWSLMKSKTKHSV